MRPMHACPIHVPMQVFVDPSSVKGHIAIISHHILTAIFLVIPWFHPKYADLMSVNSEWRGGGESVGQ